MERPRAGRRLPRMSGRTHPQKTRRLTTSWALGIAALTSLLLGACFGDVPAPDALSEATPAPTALATSTVALLQEEPPVPPGSVPLLETAAVPTSTAMATPERGADASIGRDQMVAIRLGARIEVEGTGWMIRFAQVVEDSRCPVDAQCIWAGQVIVRLLGEHSDGRVAALTLTLRAGDRGAGLLGDLPLEAVSIEPLRHAGTPPPAEYTLNLRVGTPPPALAISGVRGRVTIGPMCPVMRLDQPCPDRPYAASLVVRDSAGRLVAPVESDAEGLFALPLPEGRYVIGPASGSAVRLPSAAPQEFRVEGGRWTTLEISFDSGIR